jgi:hypothetical protein
MAEVGHGGLRHRYLDRGNRRRVGILTVTGTWIMALEDAIDMTQTGNL